MHISSFVNNPDDVSAHTNEYAAGTTSAQSFAERQAVEKSRTTIQAYRFSRLGAGVPERKQIRPSERAKQNAPSIEQATTRQEMNARSSTLQSQERTPHRFVEPPSRSYNPYA